MIEGDSREHPLQRLLALLRPEEGYRGHGPVKVLLDVMRVLLVLDAVLLILGREQVLVETRVLASVEGEPGTVVPVLEPLYSGEAFDHEAAKLSVDRVLHLLSFAEGLVHRREG